MKSTVEASKGWFGTGQWERESQAKVSFHNKTLEHLAMAARSCKNNKDQKVYLFITDMNPELEELSLQLD